MPRRGRRLCDRRCVKDPCEVSHLQLELCGQRSCMRQSFVCLVFRLEAPSPAGRRLREGEPCTHRRLRRRCARGTSGHCHQSARRPMQRSFGWPQSQQLRLGRPRSNPSGSRQRADESHGRAREAAGTPQTKTGRGAVAAQHQGAVPQPGAGKTAHTQGLVRTDVEAVCTIGSACS